MDEQITCACGEVFSFTEKERAFYEEKGFSKPKRCRPCRSKKKDYFAEKERREDSPFFKAAQAISKGN